MTTVPAPQSLRRSLPSSASAADFASGPAIGVRLINPDAQIAEGFSDLLEKYPYLKDHCSLFRTAGRSHSSA
jgi:hypothetical protein